MSSGFTPLEQAMDQVVRRRRSGSAWREIVSRQEESGLTVTAFCEREGLKAASLYITRRDTLLPYVMGFPTSVTTGWRVRLRQSATSTRTSPDGAGGD
jgi:hypothetical protein